MNGRTRTSVTPDPRPSRRSGVSLVEVAAGLGVMALFGLGVVQVTHDQNQASRALSAAAQLDQMRQASHEWVRANYPQLAANLPVGGNPVLVPVARTVPGGAVPGSVTVGAAVLPSVQGGGFLNAGLVDRNAYGQSHALLVRQPAAGTIEGLVLQVGGRPVRDADLGRIVQRVGATGGARFATNANPAMAGSVQGNAGSWTADSGVWTAGGVAPQVSRAAAQVTFGNANLLSDFLNRYDIGIPEANTMRTALNMGGQDVNNAATVRANQAVLQNGGMACASDATGCAFWVSNDGRFTDFNDGWIRFQAQNAFGGLSVEGPGGSGNLFVSGMTWSRGDFGTDGNAWVGGQALGVANDLWVGRGASVGSDLWVGRNATVSGFVASPQVWTQYLNATNADVAGTLNVGVSAAIWGAGGLWVSNDVNVGNNLFTGGSIRTGGGVFTRYLRSEGSVDAAGDVNALAQNGLGGRVFAQNRVIAGGGLQTLLAARVGTGCDIEGTLARNGSDGGLLWCQNGVWRAPMAAFSTLAFRGCAGSGEVFVNNSSQTQFVTAYWGGGDPNSPDTDPGVGNFLIRSGWAYWRITGHVAMPGQPFVRVADSSSSANWAVSSMAVNFVVPPGAAWTSMQAAEWGRPISQPIPGGFCYTVWQ